MENQLSVRNTETIAEGQLPDGGWFLEYTFTFHFHECPNCGAKDQPSFDNAQRIERRKNVKTRLLFPHAVWICDTCLTVFGTRDIIPILPEDIEFVFPTVR